MMVEAVNLFQPPEGDEMGRVIVVTSGKGGVGKTTSTAALGAALARTGPNVVVVNFDVGLRNLDLVMGAERRVVFNLINVVQGAAKLPQASEMRVVRPGFPGFCCAQSGQSLLEIPTTPAHIVPRRTPPCDPPPDFVQPCLH
jgi:cellulose biosynthesis protein BcsQ